MAATWIGDIKPMFSQYDQIMMKSKFDLHDYDAVRQSIDAVILCIQPSDDPSLAAVGWSKLNKVHVMPKVAQWTAEQRTRNLALLEDWKANGFQRGEPEPVPLPPQPGLDAFLALSAVLTGFPDVTQRRELGNKYLARLLAAYGGGPSDPPATLIAAYTSAAGGSTILSVESMEADVLTSGPLKDLAKTIIGLWYTSAFVSPLGFPDDVNGQPAFGTPDDNQYTQGLVWLASQTHPMGFSVEPTYWQNTPEASGRYTGLWPYFTSSPGAE